MRTIDFSDYKFRCSMLGQLMVNPRNKKDNLSVTTRTYLQELHKEELFGFRNEITTLEMQKGVLVEDDAIEVVSEVHNRPIESMYTKNERFFENEFICGTPDIYVEDDVLIDIKNSFTMKTFPMYYTGDLYSYNKDYYWQLQGYMELTDMKESMVARCLLDTPEEILQGIRFKKAKELNLIDVGSLPVEVEEEILRQHTFGQYPAQLRVVEIPVQHNEEHIEQLKERIALCRDYMNFLSDHLSNKLS